MQILSKFKTFLAHYIVHLQSKSVQYYSLVARVYRKSWPKTTLIEFRESTKL